MGYATLTVTVHGNNDAEIRVNAFEEAQAYFGHNVKLIVAGDYNVTTCSNKGKKYVATVSITEEATLAEVGSELTRGNCCRQEVD
jgi:hypothetical protein